MGAHHVGGGEDEGVPEGVVHVRLGREVHDSVHVLVFDDIVQQVRRIDVTLDEFVVS